MNVAVSQTIRERHKSAPYLRLKNSTRTSKVSSILFYSTRKTQSWTELGRRRGGCFSDFSTSILWQNIEKIQGGPFGDEKFSKKFHDAEKNWNFGIFNIQSVAKHHKIWRESFGEKNQKKSHNAEKN